MTIPPSRLADKEGPSPSLGTLPQIRRDRDDPSFCAGSPQDKAAPGEHDRQEDDEENGRKGPWGPKAE